MKISARALRTLVVGLATLGLASSAGAQIDPGTDSCGESDRAPAAKLAWVQVPTPDAEISGTALTLRVTSLVDVDADLRVGIVADAGGPDHAVKTIRVRKLGGRQATDVAVDLADLGLDTDAMKFAGQIVAMVKVTPKGACAGHVCRAPKEPRPGARPRPVSDEVGQGPDTLASPPVFFHRSAAGDPFAIYGEEILHSRYGGGDLEGAFEIDPDATLVRATDSGRGSPDTIALQRETATSPVDEGLGDLSPGPIPVVDYRICIKFDIGLTDAGKTVVPKSTGYTISEDYWNGKASNSGDILKIAPAFSPNMSVAGRGVGIDVRQLSGWTGISHTDPTSGCLTVHTDRYPLDLRIYADFEDKNDNRVRIVDDGAKAFYWSTKVTPKKAGATTVVHVGNYSARATLAATAGFAMYRTAFGNSDKQIDITESSFCGKPGGAENSAHYDFDDLAAGLAHVRIHDGSNPDCDPSDYRRYKFAITHEMGHAWLLLRTEVKEPSADFTLVDATETKCGTDVDGYSIGSVEYSSIGFREGTAHFYATRVWNDPDTEAVFSWFASPNDVESNNPDGDGGRIGNTCTITNTFGRSTIMDWMRFWWDWYTPAVGGHVPSFNQVAQFYQDTVLGGGLARENYWGQLRAVVSPAVTADVLKAFDCSSSWNGVDTSAMFVNCNGFPTPP